MSLFNKEINKLVMKVKIILFISLILSQICLSHQLFADPQPSMLSNFLYEYALSRYFANDTPDAIHELNKALMADSGNECARRLLEQLSGAPEEVCEPEPVVEPEPAPLKPPRAVFLAPSSLCINQEMTFDARASSDPEGRPLTYLWNFGDGTTFEEPVVIHSFFSGGSFDVSLTVRNNSGLECDSAIASTSIKVSSPPIISLTFPEKACTMSEITFDASGSRDPQSNPLRYYWDLGDGTTGEGTSIVTHIYERGGQYSVTLIVDNGQSMPCATALKNVMIQLNSAPIADAGPNSVCCLGKESIFDASGSRDPDGELLSYLWNFGDGSFAEGIWAKHRYDSVGTYTVTLKVNDNSGLPCSSSTDSFEVHVSDKPTAVIQVR